MTHILDSSDHMESRFDAANSMVWPGFPAVGIEHGDAIVAVAQQLNAQTVVVLVRPHSKLFININITIKKVLDVILLPLQFCRIEQRDH